MAALFETSPAEEEQAADFEFGAVEESYHDHQIDDRLWHAWAAENSRLAEAAIHAANRAEREGSTSREAFLQGFKLATRHERNRREAEELELLLSGGRGV